MLWAYSSLLLFLAIGINYLRHHLLCNYSAALAFQPLPPSNNHPVTLLPSAGATTAPGIHYHFGGRHLSGGNSCSTGIIDMVALDYLLFYHLVAGLSGNICINGIDTTLGRPRPQDY